jgi:hypothetical protein
MSEEDGDPGRRTEATRDQYTQRFNQLVAQARLATAGSDGPNAAAHRVTPAALVDHLVGRKHSYAASSWRLMRASAVWGMRQQAAGETAARRREIEAAVERLKAERPDPDAERPLMTSRTKAKRLPMSDLSRIRHAAAAADTAAGRDLMLFLPAANLTGLRPGEWPSAVFRRSPRPGFKYERIASRALLDRSAGTASRGSLRMDRNRSAAWLRRAARKHGQSDDQNYPITVSTSQKVADPLFSAARGDRPLEGALLA